MTQDCDPSSTVLRNPASFYLSDLPSLTLGFLPSSHTMAHDGFWSSWHSILTPGRKKDKQEKDKRAPSNWVGPSEDSPGAPPGLPHKSHQQPKAAREAGERILYLGWTHRFPEWNHGFLVKKGPPDTMAEETLPERDLWERDAFSCLKYWLVTWHHRFLWLRTLLGFTDHLLYIFLVT